MMQHQHPSNKRRENGVQYYRQRSVQSSNRAYKAAIVLNNTAISLLRQSRYSSAIETLRDALQVMRLSFRTVSDGTMASRCRNTGDEDDDDDDYDEASRMMMIMEENDTACDAMVANCLRSASERLARPVLHTALDEQPSSSSSSSSFFTILYCDRTPESLKDAAMNGDVLGLQDDLEDDEDDEDVVDKDPTTVTCTTTTNPQAMIMSECCISSTANDVNVVVVDDNDGCGTSAASAASSYYVIHIDDVDDDSEDCWYYDNDNYFNVSDDDKKRAFDTSILLNNYGVAFGAYYDGYRLCQTKQQQQQLQQEAATTNKSADSFPQGQDQGMATVKPATLAAATTSAAVRELLHRSDQFFQLACSTLDEELRSEEARWRTGNTDCNVMFSCYGSSPDCDGLVRATMLLSSIVLQNLIHISLRLNDYISSPCCCATTATIPAPLTALSSSSHHSTQSCCWCCPSYNERSDDVFYYYREIGRIQNEYTEIERFVHQHNQQYQTTTPLGHAKLSRNSNIARAA